MSAVPPQDWVLLLDDDPWALEITQAMLESHQIQVRASRTEEAALEAVRRLGPPSVLLLDVMMPGSNGFEICRRLRAQGALRHTRVVFVTALDDEASKLAALEAGADDMLSKPFSEPILVARVRSLIELARLRDRDRTRLEYEAVLDTIGEGVVTVDADDHVIAANRSARRLLGLPEDPFERVHLPSFVNDHWTVEAGTIGRSSEARIVWQGRGPNLAVALDWTSRQLPGAADAHAAWTVVVRDTTDAWERDRALSRLSRTLSHKVRIPLTGMSTGLEILAAVADLDDQSRALVQMAQESADRLRDTLIRILDFTTAVTEPRRTASRQPLEPARIREQLELRVDVELDGLLTVALLVDVDLVRRGIRELLTNARNAGASRLTLSIDPHPDGTVTFAVADDGAGLPPGITERIFEPFYQTDRSGEGEGVGLGLAILAAEVEAQGGRVGAHAPVDGLKTVWFRLPAEPAGPASTENGVDGVVAAAGRQNTYKVS